MLACLTEIFDRASARSPSCCSRWSLRAVRACTTFFDLLLHSRAFLLAKESARSFAKLPFRPRVAVAELLISMLPLSDVVANIVAGAISEAGYTTTKPLLAVAQIDACGF